MYVRLLYDYVVPHISSAKSAKPAMFALSVEFDIGFMSCKRLSRQLTLSTIAQSSLDEIRLVLPPRCGHDYCELNCEDEKTRPRQRNALVDVLHEVGRAYNMTHPWRNRLKLPCRAGFHAVCSTKYDHLWPVQHNSPRTRIIHTTNDNPGDGKQRDRDEGRRGVLRVVFWE